MMRRILIFIAVLAVPLSLIAVSALPARADETPPALSPVQGPPGTIVKASATDWPGCSSMSVSGWGRTLGTATINSAGAFSLSFTVPSDAALGATQLQFSPTCTHSTYIPFVTFTVTQGTPPPPACPTNPRVTFSPNSGPLTTTFTITGSGWVPGGKVTSTIPYGSPGWFTGYQTPTVAANGGFSYKETVGTGPGGPTPPGTYTFTYVEKYGGCSLSFHQTFTVTPKPPAGHVPAAPSNLTVTAVDPHDIRLNWQDNSDNETGFEINNGVVSKKAGPNSTTYTWGGLAPGTYMCFKIRAYNSAGDSAWEPNVSPYYRCATTPLASIKDINYSPWAGYSIDFTNPKNTPLSVSAAWTIPKVSCTNNGTPISGQVAVWDGLGGVYSGNTLEQIGTDSQCIKGKAKYWPWYEFPPQNPIHIDKNGKYSVSYGDSMRAAVTDQGAGQFALQLWDDTKHWYYPVLWINRSSSAVPRTGEWIVEDPAGAAWPQFTNNVVFKNCYWVQNGPQAALRVGDNITRYTIYTTGLLSQPKDVTWDPAPDRTDFAVQWQHY